MSSKEKAFLKTYIPQMETLYLLLVTKNVLVYGSIV